MEIVLANQPWAAFGGSETYLLTVGPQLQRLGHEVVIYAPAAGEAAEAARERGLRVAVSEPELPDAPQVVLSQHSESAYRLAERYPDAVRVYVAHSPIFEPQRPPQVPGVVHAIVVMNEGTRRQAEALGHSPEVVRMTQPIDIERFNGRGEPGARARRVLLLGNHWLGPGNRNYEVVAAASERLGLELDHVGAGGRVSAAAEIEIARADIVVGLGRCVLEAMSAGRPAYVFGNRGGDGWVTPEDYPQLEARGFSGVSLPKVSDAPGLVEDLRRYDPEMGPVNRELVIGNHDSVRHAADLVSLFERLEPAAVAAPTELGTLARMARVQQETESRVWVAEADATVLRRELTALRDHHQAVVATRRYRIAGWIAAPLDAGRRLLARLRRRFGRGEAEG